MQQQKAVFYWPYMHIYSDIFLHKDPIEISKNLQNIGYETTFIIGKTDVLVPGIKTLETGNCENFRLKDNVKEFLFLIRYFKENRNTSLLIVFNSGPMAILAPVILSFVSWIKKNLNKPRIILKMDTDGNIEKGNVLKFFYMPLGFLIEMLVYNKIIVESSCAFEKLKRLPLLKKKFKVISNGYSEEVYPKKITYDEVSREKKIITVSRVSREKSLETLINAFYSVSLHDQEWKFQIVGPIIDVGYYKELVSRIAELRLSDKVEFLGFVNIEQLKNLYRTSSIFALSSMKEGFNISTVEAIVNGLPVVTTNAGCPSDISGVQVVEIYDTNRLAEKLNELIQNPDIRSKIVRKEQESILSWKEVTISIIN